MEELENVIQRTEEFDIFKQQRPENVVEGIICFKILGLEKEPLYKKKNFELREIN